MDEALVVNGFHFRCIPSSKQASGEDGRQKNRALSSKQAVFEDNKTINRFPSSKQASYEDEQVYLTVFAQKLFK